MVLLLRPGYLWLQERVAAGALEVRKVPGDANPADLFTKALNRDKLDQFLADMEYADRGGRHRIGYGLNV